MLGLGLGVNRSQSASENNLVLIYSSDFTSGTESWNNWNAPASSTVVANQTAPDSSTGWLLQTFGGDETNNGGILKTLTLPSPALFATEWKITGKVYFEETSAEWGGAIASWRVQFADSPRTIDFAVNEVVDFALTKTGVTAMSSSELFYLYGSGTATTIASGAKVYYKDLKVYAVL